MLDSCAISFLIFISITLLTDCYHSVFQENFVSNEWINDVKLWIDCNSWHNTRLPWLYYSFQSERLIRAIYTIFLCKKPLKIDYSIFITIYNNTEWILRHGFGWCGLVISYLIDIHWMIATAVCLFNHMYFSFSTERQLKRKRIRLNR